jgi:hypothetical protein
MTILNVMKYMLISIGAVVFIIVIVLIIRSRHKVCYSNDFICYYYFFYFRQIHPVLLFLNLRLMKQRHYSVKMSLND